MDRWRALGAAIRKQVGEDPHVVFEHVGKETFGASVFVARRGGSIVTCGSSTGYAHHYDNRHLWMRVSASSAATAPTTRNPLRPTAS